MDGELSMQLEGSNHMDELLYEQLWSTSSCVVPTTVAQNPKTEMWSSDTVISPQSEPIPPQTSLRPM